MGRADQYRHYAAECMRLTRQTKDEKEKAILLQMAESWRQLANRAQLQEQER